MKNFPDIKGTVTRKNWKFLVKNSLPVNITDSYPFVKALFIAEQLFESSADEMAEDGFTADLMRDFAVNLMTILRAKHPNEWNADWKNEAFLGIICGFVYREEEAFVYLKNAFKQLADPPQSLLLAYISAGTGPDHFLSKEEVARLSQKLIEKGATYEAALHMAFLANEQKDLGKHRYWEKKSIEAEKNGFHTPFIIPNVLKNLVQPQKGYSYED